MLKEFIRKAIETQSGFPADCWIATEIHLDVKANQGYIRLEGYKDFEAKEAGKQVMGTVLVPIADLMAMQSAAAVHADVLATVFASDQFAAATLEQREVAEPAPLNQE
jgi:hypothetical protein